MRKRLFLSLAPLLFAGLSSASAGEISNMLKDSGAVGPTLRPATPREAPVAVPLPAGQGVGVVDPEAKALSEETARQVYRLELDNRLLEAQAKNEKIHTDLAKLKADQIKAGMDAKAAMSAVAQASGFGAAAAMAAEPGSGPRLPSAVVRWVAGREGNLQALVMIQHYGSVVLHKGSRLPLSDNFVVDAVRSDGVLVKDQEGRVYPIGFGG